MVKESICSFEAWCDHFGRQILRGNLPSSFGMEAQALCPYGAQRSALEFLEGGSTNLADKGLIYLSFRVALNNLQTTCITVSPGNSGLEASYMALTRFISFAVSSFTTGSTARDVAKFLPLIPFPAIAPSTSKPIQGAVPSISSRS